MTQTRMPPRLLAGDALALEIPVGDYPASGGYTVALVLQPLAGGTVLTVAATDGSDAWDIAVTSVQTGALAAGLHRYLIAATLAGERSTIAHGEVMVQANPASGSTDQRSAARQALDAIDATLSGRASSADRLFEFEDGRRIEKIGHDELLRLRRHYARIVARENRQDRGPRRVLIRQ